MNPEPTNADLQRSIKEQNHALSEYMKATRRDIEEINKRLDPIIDVYKAVVLSKSFILGLAGVIVALTAIGVGFVWLINSVIKH